MLQELAALTDVKGWAIASLLIVIATWVAIAAWVWRARSADMEARARLALEGDIEDGRRASPDAPAKR